MTPIRWTAALLCSLALCLGLVAAAGGEVVQKGNARVSFEGHLTPKALPRSEEVPVQVSVGTKITALNPSNPPRLRTISIAINSAGRFSPSVLPTCTVREIQPSTTQNALKACRPSLVGSGSFSAQVLLHQQASFPSSGKLYAFNGRYEGHPAILAHVYGTEPVPTSFTLPFVISERKGQLGTVLTSQIAEATGTAGYITGISLNIDGGSGSGKTPYIGASCPAPRGFGGATFPFAKASFDFGSRSLSSTLTRSCKVRG